MAIVALALYALTIAVGVYMLVTSTRVKADVAEAEPAAVPAADPKDRFDPLSLRAAKSEPIPGLRALGEFTHPALALIGFAFWLLYTMIHDQIFAAIALGVLLGAIAAGITWAVSNGRAVKKEKDDALVLRGRTLLFHVAGAALTLLVAAYLTVRLGACQKRSRDDPFGRMGFGGVDQRPE